MICTSAMLEIRIMTLSSFANKLFFKWKRFKLFLTATVAAMQTMATHCSILAGHVYFFVKIISFSLRYAVSDRRIIFNSMSSNPCHDLRKQRSSLNSWLYKKYNRTEEERSIIFLIYYLKIIQASYLKTP